MRQMRRWYFRAAISVILSLLATVPGAGHAAGGTGGTYLETRISDLENQLRGMNGRLEQAEWQNKQLRATLERLQGDVDQRLNHLERASSVTSSGAVSSPQASGVAHGAGFQAAPDAASASAEADSVVESEEPASLARDPHAVPPDRNLTADMLPDGKQVQGQLGKLYMSGGQVRGADRDMVTPTLPPKPDDYGLTSREQYDRAFQLLRESNFDEAETAFKNFIGKNPKDKLIDNAKYWLGETYYARGRFDAAAVAFADAYQAAPKGGKAADSLFKLGMALEGMNKREDACTTFVTVRTQFPHATRSMKTRIEQETKKLKCK